MLERLKSAKIIIIDDSKMFLMATKGILEEYGCIVETIQDPKEAVNAIKKFNPDVVISDYEMPDLSGPELCKVIKSDSNLKFIPVIVVTGKEESESLIEAISAGADDFITKSSLNEVLVTKVCCNLRLKQMNLELNKLEQLEVLESLIGRLRHDFNNHLAIIEGSLIRYRKKELTEENKYIEAALTGAERMKETIKKLSELEEIKMVDYSESKKIIKI